MATESTVTDMMAITNRFLRLTAMAGLSREGSGTQPLMDTDFFNRRERRKFQMPKSNIQKNFKLQTSNFGEASRFKPQAPSAGEGVTGAGRAL
jgi:hypothetical protein